MRVTSLNGLSALVLAVFSTLTAAPAVADTPGTVGRIATVHGYVSIAGAGEASAAASLNWPVAAGDTLSTVRGAEAEFRVGGAAVRLDGDTDLVVDQLDDGNFRLRLLRGSAAVRIGDPALLGGFELNAGEARVVLLQTGWVRVDTARQPGVITVSVLAGTAQVDGPGSSLQVPAGRRAELNNGDLLTGSLERDRFDDWAEPRQSTALQYVSPEVTGYEELDRYGSWSDSTEYGPLWAPRGIPAGWSPYQDGRWIWRDAWGWTWIDNAPWGYAPSHYGSWVQVGPSWRWAPGRGRPRPVWAPAVVGWHGNYPDRPRGGSYGVRGPRPAVGWFPLTPRDNFVPGQRTSPDYAQRVDNYRRGRADVGRPPRDNTVHGVDPQRGWNGAPPGSIGALPAGQAPQARSRPQIRPGGDGPRDTRYQQGQMEAAPTQPGRAGDNPNRLLQTEMPAGGAFAAQPGLARGIDRREQDRQQSERQQQERQQTERQQMERQQIERQQQARQQMERQQGERQQMERQQAERQQMERQRAQAIQRPQQQPQQPAQQPPQILQRAQQAQQPQPVQQPAQPQARPQQPPSAQPPSQPQGQLQRRAEIRAEQQRAGQNSPPQMER